MKCPRCGKELIDEWEMFEHANECAVSCYNCKHSAVAANKEPCKSCWNRSKWEKRKDGEKDGKQ